MSEQTKDNKIRKEGSDNWSVNDLDEEGRRNLLGFFDLLIKVDRRVNPHLYQKQNQNDDN
jgi:hypothetical protein